ncbi:MAG: AAA family ATPase, partial [Candidatus Heimdallarchaeaceae archaeon]
MLKSLSLHSFQAHEDTLLTFSSGVNIITGTSNSGKTSIMRTLNWIINNRPLGDGFIKDDKENAVGVLEINRRGKVFQITRERDRKSKNLYKIDTQESHQKFTAFGNTVPEEVSNLLDLSDINLQQQLSPYFLVL